MEALKYIPYIALILTISGIVLGAGVVVLSKFNDTTSDTQATLAIGNATAAVGDTAEQMPTVAIIGVMIIIISLIAGVFVYLKWFQ